MKLIFLYSLKIKNLIKVKLNILDYEQVGRNDKWKSMVYNFVLLVVIGIPKQEKKRTLIKI